MDAIVYSKIKSEADRIVDLIGGIPKVVVDNVAQIRLLPSGNITPNYYLPSELELIFEPKFQVENIGTFLLNLSNLMGSNWSDNGLRKITITIQPERYVAITSAFNSQQYLESITFTNGVKTIYDFNQVFNGCQRLKEINGIIDVGLSWVNNSFQNCSALEEVRFAENCIGKTSPNNFIFGNSPNLSDDSLISVANGLYEGASKTIQLHATPKSTCGTIMGTVAMDSSNTYHVFTKNDSGTVSLADFITDTKGWTLA